MDSFISIGVGTAPVDFGATPTAVPSAVAEGVPAAVVSQRGTPMPSDAAVEAFQTAMAKSMADNAAVEAAFGSAVKAFAEAIAAADKTVALGAEQQTLSVPRAESQPAALPAATTVLPDVPHVQPDRTFASVAPVTVATVAVPDVSTERGIVIDRSVVAEPAARTFNDASAVQPNVPTVPADVPTARTDASAARPDVPTSKASAALPEATVAQTDRTSVPAAPVPASSSVMHESGVVAERLVVVEPAVRSSNEAPVVQPDVTAAQIDVPSVRPDVQATQPGVPFAQTDKTFVPETAVVTPSVVVEHVVVAEQPVVVEHAARPLEGAPIVQPNGSAVQPDVQVVKTDVPAAGLDIQTAHPDVPFVQTDRPVVPGVQVAAPSVVSENDVVVGQPVVVEPTARPPEAAQTVQQGVPTVQPDVPVAQTEKPVVPGAQVPAPSVVPESGVVVERPVVVEPAARPAKGATPVQVDAPVVRARVEVESVDETPEAKAENMIAAGFTPGVQAAAESMQKVADPSGVQAVEAVRARTVEVAERVAKTMTASEVLVQAAEAVADTILVSPGLLRGEGEIRVQLKPDVLDGTEIRIGVAGRNLDVAFMPRTADMSALIEQCRPQLEQHLAARIHRFTVNVSVGAGRKARSDEE